MVVTHYKTAIARTVFGGLLAWAMACLPQLASAKNADGKWVIAVSLQTEQEPIWHTWVAMMQEEAKAQGAVLIIQYAQRDDAKQAAQTEQLLAQTPDAFIFNPVNPASAGPIVEGIKAENIPVVAFDNVVENTLTDYLVIRDNYQTGKLAAEAAVKAAPSGNYAFIKGGPTWNGYKSVVSGYSDALKNATDIKTVFDQNTEWDPARAQSLAENALSANKDDIAAFIVMNDGIATGVTVAVSSRNLSGKVFISGMDGETQALKKILTGAQTMTVYTDLEDYGRTAVRTAVMLAKGEKPPSDQITRTSAGDVPTHLVGVTSVDRSNLCEVITTKMAPGWTSVQEVYGTATCK
jgi:D-xylose transport system substrate-binding protein